MRRMHIFHTHIDLTGLQVYVFDTGLDCDHVEFSNTNVRKCANGKIISVTFFDHDGIRSLRCILVAYEEQ